MKPTRMIIYMLLTFLVLGLAACDKPTPQELRKRQHLPDKDFIANLETGSHLFNTNCSRCHGSDAKGSEHGPSLLDKVYRAGHHADLTFHWAVKDGVKQHHWQFGNMPPIDNLSPNDVGNIIAYVRAEQRKVGIE